MPCDKTLELSLADRLRCEGKLRGYSPPPENIAYTIVNEGTLDDYHYVYPDGTVKYPYRNPKQNR